MQYRRKEGEEEGKEEEAPAKQIVGGRGATAINIDQVSGQYDQQRVCECTVLWYYLSQGVNVQYMNKQQGL